MIRLGAFLLLLFFFTSSASASDYFLYGDYPTDPVPANEAFEIPTLLDHPAGLPTSSWKFGFCISNPDLEIVDVLLGTDTMALNGGAGPSFFAPEIFIGEGWSVDVVVSFAGGGFLPTGEGLELHRTRYIGLTPGSTEVEPCDIGVGPPVFVDAAGAETIPAVEGGTVFVTTPPPDPNYSLYLNGSGTQTVGTNFDVASMLDFPNGNDISGWAVEVCQTDTNVNPIAVVDGFTTAGLDVFFNSVTLYPGGGWRAAIVLDVIPAPGEVLPPGTGYELHVAEYEALGSGPVTLCYCSNLGGLGVDTHVVSQSQIIYPTTQCHVLNVDAVDGASPKVYWTDIGHNKIRRCDPDGSNIEELVTTNLEAPGSIVIDTVGLKMYWADWVTATAWIRRANLDGTNVETVHSGLQGPYGVAIDPVGGHIYWTEFSVDLLRRSDLNGANIVTLVPTGPHPNGVVLDLGREKVYWSEGLGSGSGAIKRANLDGTNVETVVDDLEVPMEMAIDFTADRIYWCDLGSDLVQSANLDGSGLQTVVPASQSFGTPVGLDLDVQNGKVYWTDSGSLGSVVRRANLDGSGLEDIVPSGIGSSYGLTLATVPDNLSGGNDYLRGDADGNGIFNALADALFVLEHGFLGGPPPECMEAADADGNGTFNALTDGLYVLEHGFLDGPPLPPPYPGCGPDPDPAGSLGCEVAPPCP